MGHFHITIILHLPFFHFRSDGEGQVGSKESRERMDQNRKNGSNYQAGGTCSTDNNTAKQTTGPCHYRVVYRGCSDIATMCRIATQIHEDIEKKKKKLRESGT